MLDFELRKEVEISKSIGINISVKDSVSEEEGKMIKTIEEFFKE